MVKSNDIKVLDAFEQLFDASGRAAIALLTAKGNNLELEEILNHFISSTFYGFPGSDIYISNPSNGTAPPMENRDKSWNIFTSNPAASALAACIVDTIQKTSNEQLQARQLVSLAIPKYIAFLAHSLIEFAEDYSRFVDRDSVEQTDFDRMLGKLKNVMTSNGVKKTAAGIENLIDALMFIRERRVEEVPLTFEINLGPFGLWESIDKIGATQREPEDGMVEVRNHIKLIEDSLKAIDLIGKIPTKKIAKDVETNAKHFGRGVAILKLSTKANGEIQINVTKLWKTHEEAPLSNLYGFDWSPPSSEQNEIKTELHLVLLPSGVISVQVGGDPLVEYFAGGWRYVDTYHKSMILSQRASTFNEDLMLTNEGISLPIYRCCRLAYQLSYHNHGSTVDLNFGPAIYGLQGKLRGTIIKGGIFDPDENWWREIKSKKGESETEGEGGHLFVETGEKIGRWVYQLCVSDGITSLYVDEDSKLQLGDFGQIIQFKDEIKTAWKSFFQSIPGNEESDAELGGGRHTAAIQCAFDDMPYKDKGKMVFCVSQDGYIDVYMKDDWLKLR